MTGWSSSRRSRPPGGDGVDGNGWPPRDPSILMSVLLFPPAHLAPAGPEAAFGCAWLIALAAVATAEVVAAWTGREATIKWPNDVRVDGRKIAGILVERATPHRGTALPGGTGEPARGVVIGIGLNVNLDHEAFPPELRPLATSLRIERGAGMIDRSEVARELIQRLDHWYEASLSLGCETLNAPWCTRSEHLGRDVRVITPTGPRDGRLVDLDVRHGLTLALEMGPEPVDHGGRPAPLVRLPMAEVLALHAPDSHDPSSNASSDPGTSPAVLID